MNVILKRELIDVFRTRKSLVMQVLLVLIFALLVILRWPTESQVDLSGDHAKEVFRLFGYGFLTVIILMSPAFPAASVVREKNRGTLALLFNSPIPNWQIYFGKLLGVSGFLILLIVLSLPAALACLSLGGVSFGKDVVPLYGILLLLVIQYAVLGMWVSSLSNSSDGALRTTYLLILSLAVLSLVPYLLFQGQESLITEISWWIRSLSPLPAVMEILGHGFVGSQGVERTSEIGTLTQFFLVNGLVTLALLADTLYRFNHKLFDKPRSAGTMTNDMETGTKVARGIYFLYFFDPRQRKSGVPPLVNPVLVKEFRTRRFGRSHWLMRIIAMCSIASLILAYLSTQGTLDWGTEVIGGIMITLQAGLIVLFTPSLAAGLICGEVESGGWQLLQMTPMSATRIVVGKLLSVFWTMSLVLCATLPGYLVMGWIVPEKWLQINQVLICLIWATVFSVFVSACMSSLFNKTAAATVAAYSALSLLYVGTFFFWLFEGKPFGHRLVESILQFNPIAAAMQVIETPGFAELDIVRTNWWIMGIGSLVCLAILIVQTVRLSRPQ